MTDSLRDSEIDVNLDRAFAQFQEAIPYTPDETAYEIDEANNPYAKFVATIKAGAPVELSLMCSDGRREFIKLDHQESIAWMNGSLDERIEFANAKIQERRATCAMKAAFRLRERGVAPSSKTLTPDEEACLREFDLLDDALEPLAEGGYRKSLRLREAVVSRIKLREDGFWDGGFDSAVGTSYAAPTQREYLPRGGPSGQQMQLSDRWDELAKAYFAWTHDPVARAACELITDFILGRGVAIVANDKNVQDVIDEYVERESLNERLHTASVSLSRDGNLITREFKLGDGRLKHRVLPVETIWEIVTDAEDPLDVYWYVQRYQTRFVMFAPSNLPQAQQKWIERQVAGGDIIHKKVNAKESDVWGRSDLYPALGWMKRLRDYFDAIIQKEYAAAAYQWWYKVKGGQGDLSRIAANVIPAKRPVPGSYMMTNDGVEVQALASQVRAVSGSGTAYEALLNHIALAFVLSKSYFGADSHENRASALVATEPSAKHLETRQDVINDYLSQIIKRVIKEAKAHGLIPESVSDFGFKCVFPQIIKADSAARSTAIRQGEASFYWSRRTAAEQCAGEAEIEDYDFDDEMAAIEEEIGCDPLKLTAKDQEPVKRGLPSPGDAAFNPGEVPDPSLGGQTQPQPHQADGTTPQLPAADPAAASPTSATGAAKIRDERGRGGSEDRSTVESVFVTDALFAEACKARGVVVIRP